MLGFLCQVLSSHDQYWSSSMQKEIPGALLCSNWYLLPHAPWSWSTSRLRDSNRPNRLSESKSQPANPAPGFLPILLRQIWMSGQWDTPSVTLQYWTIWYWNYCIDSHVTSRSYHLPLSTVAPSALLNVSPESSSFWSLILPLDDCLSLSLVALPCLSHVCIKMRSTMSCSFQICQDTQGKIIRLEWLGREFY